MSEYLIMKVDPLVNFNLRYFKLNYMKFLKKVALQVYLKKKFILNQRYNIGLSVIKIYVYGLFFLG